MKNTLSFFITNHLYKGKITCQRVKEIIESYGFTLFEYDLDTENDTTEAIRSLGLTSYAEVTGSFTYVSDAYHKYVFIRSGETEKDKIYMLLHEAGHIYKEHFAIEELVHNTHYKKERQADLFSSVQIFLNRISRALPYMLTLLF